MPIENRKIPCPFCNAMEVDGQITPKEVTYNTSRAAGRSVTRVGKIPEKTEALSGCPKCGKSKTDINKALKGNKSTLDPEARKRRLEQLKALGFSGVIGGK